MPNVIGESKSNELLSSEEMLDWVNKYRNAANPDERDFALEMLFHYSNKLINKIVNEIMNFKNVPYIYQQDLISVARMSFMHAIEKYNPNKKTKLTTYAYQWIHERVERAADKIFKNEYHLSLDHLDSEGICMYDVIPGSQFDFATIQRHALLEKLRSILDDDEFAIILDYYFFDKSVPEIARERNIDKEKAWSKIKCVNDKLKRRHKKIDLRSLLDREQ